MQQLLAEIRADNDEEFADVPADALRRAGATLARATVGRSSVATSIASLTDDAGLEAFVVGAVLGSFSFSWRSQERPESSPVARIVLTGCAEDRRPALERGLALGGAGWRARLLATVPSNLKNPPWLAEQARLVAEEAGLAYRVWDEQQLAAEGFGGIIGVGQGSATPPRLVRLDYTPRKANRRTPTVVLVGKGITFDTGGLSIKPAEGMTTMKRDMTGAAVVLSVMAALEAVGCPVKVVGLLACAENAVSGSSMRPGDVLRHYGGRTTEVTNTDAEGRLVMADALAYAVAELAPAALVDLAVDQDLPGGDDLLGLRAGLDEVGELEELAQPDRLVADRDVQGLGGGAHRGLRVSRSGTRSARVEQPALPMVRSSSASRQRSTCSTPSWPPRASP